MFWKRKKANPPGESFEFEEVEYKVFFVFNVHARNIERFSLRDEIKDMNIFRDREKSLSRKAKFKNLVDTLNEAYLTKESYKEKKNHFWKLVDFVNKQDITINDPEKNENPIFEEDYQFIGYSIEKNRERYLKASFYNSEEFISSLKEDCAIRKLLTEFSNPLIFPSTYNPEDQEISAQLKRIDFWFYDWNVGGWEFTFSLSGVSNPSIKAEKFSQFTRDLFNFSNRYISPQKASNGNEITLGRTIIDDFGKKLLDSCGLNVSSREQHGKKDWHAQFLYGHMDGLIIWLKETAGGTIKQSTIKNTIKSFGLFGEDFLGIGSDILFISIANMPSIVIKSRRSVNSQSIASKTVWIWRFAILYWSALEWLNVLFSRELDEIGQIYYPQKRKPTQWFSPSQAWSAFQKFANAPFKRKEQNKAENRLLHSAHHTKNRMLAISGELSELNVADNDLERALYSGLRKSNNIDLIEKKVIEITREIIDEQRKHKEDQRNWRLKAIQNLIISNIFLGIGITVFQISLHFYERSEDKEYKASVSDLTNRTIDLSNEISSFQDSVRELRFKLKEQILELEKKETE